MNTLLGSLVYQYFAATPACDKSSTFLGILPKWYEYLPYDRSPITNRCEVMVDLHDKSGALQFNGLLPIGLAILDMLLRIIAVVAVGFIIYGAFRYITSQGEPENTKNAQSTIINAVIGVVIAIIASSIVAFIGHRIGG